MKVVIDTERCSGHGRCYGLSPSVFDSDDDGRGVVVVGDLDSEQCAAAQVAVSNCPEKAISIID